MAPSEDVETTTQVQVIPVDPRDQRAFAAWYAEALPAWLPPQFSSNPCTAVMSSALRVTWNLPTYPVE